MVSRFSRFRVPLGELPIATSRAADYVLYRRNERAANAKGGALIGFAVGVSAGLAASEFSKVKQKVLLTLGSAAAGAGIGAVHGLWKNRALVRMATIEVGKALCKAWTKNRFVEALVNHYPYLIVDAKGGLVGARTNPNRLGFGRLRLVTSKIRDGSYLQERGVPQKLFSNFDLDKFGAQSIVRLLIAARNTSNRKNAAELLEKLKEQLAVDALHDKNLEEFLHGTPYFYVGKEGDLVAAKTCIWNKAGLGRKRLSSKDVLEELGRARWLKKNFPNGLPPQ